MIGAGRLDATGAAYFDGDSPIGQPVGLRLSEDGQTLLIELADRVIAWQVTDVRSIDDFAGKGDSMLRMRRDPVARLFTPNPFVRRALPHLTRRAPPAGRGRLAMWAGAAVCAVFVQIAVLVPFLADQLADYIPLKGERALGDATFEQIKSALADNEYLPLQTCENAEGLAALTQMQNKLTASLELEQELRVFVLDHPMINAFALPGGYVVFFRGLIEAAQAPEEVAAVFGHEIGHVVSRDPTRHALRSAGSIGVLGLMFGDFAGGAVVLFLAERLIDAQYSQGAEAAADTFAYDVLHDAQIEPAALGDMFQRLKDEHGETEGIVAHFLSHPSLDARIQAARDASDRDTQVAPVLDAEAWAALQNICK